MNRRTMLMRPALAWAAVIIAVVAGSALGQQHHWDRPRQLLHPPYVDKVPFTLLAAFILLALTGLFVAALLQRPLVPTRPAGSRGWLLAAVAVAGTMAATWAALYTTSIEDAALPVLDWAFFAVPVGLASVLARGADGDDAATRRPFVTGVLVAVPIAAVNGLGWSIYSAPQSRLSFSLISDGFGIIAGLTTAYFHHRPEPRPLAERSLMTPNPRSGRNHRRRPAAPDPRQ